MLGAASAAHAQQAPWAPERLTPGWFFTPGVVIGALWDSNVTVSSAGNPQIPEWVGLVNPRGEIDFNGRHTHVNGGYSGALEKYRRFDELQRYEQHARFQLRQEVSPRLKIGTSASFSAVPTTDRLDIAIANVPFTDVGSQVFDAGGEFTFSMSEKTHVSGLYRFDHVAFDSKVAGVNADYLFGGHSHETGLRIGRSLTSRLSVGTGWDYQYSDLREGRQISNVNTVDADVSYRAGRGTTVSGGAGASHLTIRDTGLSTWGPALRASIEQRVGRGGLVGARYERSFTPSYTVSGMNADQSMGLNANVPVGRGRSYVTGSLSYGRTRPVKELGFGFELDSVFTYAGVGYHLNRWLQAEAFFSEMHQTSTALLDVNRTRIGIQFITGKPLRID
jgi:hypothetical protein